MNQDLPTHRPGFIAVLAFDEGDYLELKEGVESIDQPILISSNTIFNLASLSKQFTAFSILLLEQANKLSLSDKLSTYFPQMSICADQITLQHLIYHTSGLYDYIDVAIDDGVSLNQPYTVQDTLHDIFRETQTKFQAGTKFEYSNTGYFLLAQIIEQVTQTSFSVFAKQNIFEPLGMFNTTIVEKYPLDFPMATGYKISENHQYEISESLWTQTGDGAVHSTVNDLLKWGHNFKTCQIGGKALINKMMTVLPKYHINHLAVIDHESYAYGLLHVENEDENILEHSGEWLGFVSYFLRDIKNSFTLIVLSNNEDLNVHQIASQMREKARIIMT